MSSEMSVGWYKMRDGSMSFWNGLQWTETTPPPGTSGPQNSRAHKHWWHRK